MTPDSPPSVLLDIADGIARVTLNRPDRANALDHAMAAELGRALDRVRDEQARVVVVRGAGKRFCAGGDVSSFLSAADPASRLHELATLAESSMRALGDLPVPVVVGAHGAVAGAGLGFLLNADVVVVSRSLSIVAGYPAIGLSPDAGISWLLPRAVGLQRASRHLLTNELLTGEEAVAWGLAAEAVDDDREVVARTDEIAARMASYPAGALAAAKRLLRASWATTREENAIDEADTIASRIATPEAAALVAAFGRR